MIFIAAVELRPRKSSLVSGNRLGKNLLSLTCLHSGMCIRMYIFNFKKQQTNKKTEQESKKVKEKETKEEKRISQENRLKKNFFAVARVKIFLVTRISGKKRFFGP